MIPKYVIWLLGFWLQSALSQEMPPPDTPAVTDLGLLRAEATDLRQRAKHMRLQADKTKLDADTLCRQKFLMSACLEEARQAHQEAGRAARRIDLQAIEIEQHLRRIDHEKKTRQNAERETEQAAQAARRAEDLRRKDEKRAGEREKREAREERRRQKALQ